jgi:hypothetical protein
MRRNHAIEHATVHILSASRSGVTLAGRSDGGGFVLYGNVSTAEVRAAVDLALARLPEEPWLAVHPHCGTNLVVAGMVSGVASLLALWTAPREERAGKPLEVLPRLLLAGTLAAALSQPLGPLVQRRMSTLPDVRGSRVRGIVELGRGRYRLHRVEMAHDRPPAAASPAQASGDAADAGAAEA